jgi:hypothetical protein
MKKQAEKPDEHKCSECDGTGFPPLRNPRSPATESIPRHVGNVEERAERERP